MAQGDDLQLSGDMACENAEVRGELRWSGLSTLLSAYLDAYVEPWGDGSAGDLVFDGVSSVLGVLPITVGPNQVYEFTPTLALIIQARNIEIAADVIIDLSSCGVVLATGVISGDPTSQIRRRVNNGGNGTAGAGGIAGALGPLGFTSATISFPANTSAVGAAGGNPGANGGNVGVSAGLSDAALPPAQGAPGGPGSTGGGGVGGGNTGITLLDGWYATMSGYGLANVLKNKNTSPFGFVAFGGGGGGGGVGAGGGGGGAGGFPLMVHARDGIEGGFTIAVPGGNGGNGFNGGATAGGGGGGGGGGRVFTLRRVGAPLAYLPNVAGGSGGLPGNGSAQAGFTGLFGAQIDFTLS